MSKLRAVAFYFFSKLPQRLRHWLYSKKWLRSRLAPLLKHLVSADTAAIVTVPTGPLHDVKLAVYRDTPNYYWLDDRYEAETIAFLREYAKQGAIVADIGAHIGFYTLLLSRYVGGTGTVLALEPDPANLVRLRQNLKINSINNVRVIDRAAAATTCTLYFDARGHTTSQLVSDEALPESAIQVRTVSLDELFCQEHTKIPSLLKIDVEDYEAAVLQGGKQFLSQNRPTLLLEIHSKQSMLDCLRLLMPLAYNFTLLEKTGDDFVASALSRSSFPTFPCHVACVAKTSDVP
jgi:FkbM family methyltransferase